MTKNLIIDQVMNDPHPSKKRRENGAIQNPIDFANAFHCSPGAPMNPQKKCRIW
jgi:predicted metalloendopeptidase